MLSRILSIIVGYPLSFLDLQIVVLMKVIIELKSSLLIIRFFQSIFWAPFEQEKYRINMLLSDIMITVKFAD